MNQTLHPDKHAIILDAAQKRFARFGVGKVTMEEISADLGMSKAALYYYFKTKEEIFRQGYQGWRYSFGYPACPRLEDQEALFKLLRPEEIGVELTDGFMMDPEASVSALVFHHPDASYFTVSEEPVAPTTE